jgi:hypothetical protein
MSALRAGAMTFLFALGSCAPLPLAFNGKAGTQSIDHGRRFGVEIGMERGAARLALLKNRASHFAFSEKCRDYPASHQMCDGATDTDHFRIDGILGTGIVDLNVRDDHVVRIIWVMHGYEII